MCPLARSHLERRPQHRAARPRVVFVNRSRSIPQFSAADFDRHRPPKPASAGLGPRSISPRTYSPQRPGRRRRDVRCSVVARTSPRLVSKFVRFSFRRASQSMALLACWALGARSVLAASIWMCLEALARGLINCHPVSATAVVYEPRARRARPGQEDQTIVLCGSLNKFGGGLKISPRSLHRSINWSIEHVFANVPRSTGSIARTCR